MKQQMKRLKEQYPNHLVAFFYALILLLCFVPLFNGTASLNWDAFDLWLPWKHFIVEEFYNGHLPLWNPYHGNGFPQHGDTMTWYPISWALGVLFGGYNLTALNTEYVFHLFIAGFGFYTLAGRYAQKIVFRFLLGLSFMVSGFMLGNAQHVAWIVSAAWLPWLLYFFLRIIERYNFKDLMKLSLVGFFFFSGGYLAIFFVTAYCLAGVALIQLYKKRKEKTALKVSIRLMLAFLLIGILSLPLLYAASQTFPWFNRYEGTLDIHLGASPWNGILAILFPFSSGIYNVHEIEFGSFSSYLGLIPILLVTCSLRRVIHSKTNLLLLGLSLFFLMASLGNMLPIRSMLSQLPFLDLFRYPGLFRLFFIFFLLLLLSRLSFEDSLSRLKGKWYFIPSSILLLGLFIFFLKLGDFSALKTYLNDILRRHWLEDVSLYNRLAVNVFILFFVNLLFCVAVLWRKKVTAFSFLFFLWGLELFVFAYSAAPHVVYQPMDVSYANELLKLQPKNYPQVDKNHPIHEKELWNGYLDFAWQGKTFYNKQFSKHWYNPLSFAKPKKGGLCYIKTPLDSLPLFGVLKENKGLEADTLSSLSLEVKSSQELNFRLKSKRKEEHYIFLKQHAFHEWDISKNATIVSSNHPEVMLVKLNDVDQFKLRYTHQTYDALFWISMVVCCLLLFVLLVIYWKTDRKLLSFILFGFSVVFYINNDRLHPFEMQKEVKPFSQDLISLNEKQLKMLPKRVYLKQNVSRSDREWAIWTSYFSVRGLVQDKKCLYWYLERRIESEKCLIGLIPVDRNVPFWFDLEGLVRENKIETKTIQMKLHYKSVGNAKLWLVHSRDNEWLDGKAWDLKPSKRGFLLDVINCSKYRLKTGDKLKVFVEGDSLNATQIQKFSLFQRD